MRLALVVPMIWVLVTLVFVLLRVIGDPITAAQGGRLTAEQIAERSGFHRMYDLGGAEAFEFCEQRGFGLDFRGEKIVGGQINEREAKCAATADDGGLVTTGVRR